ncbi:hypothetical protein DZA50_06860 [Kangiella sp. HD9-110m-PIT-SAG07]|nr:hypothetical protein DZA50_06860 [Kangiella sp. HD9-110m-PIT-SAG07]
MLSYSFLRVFAIQTDFRHHVMRNHDGIFMNEVRDIIRENNNSCMLNTLNFVDYSDETSDISRYNDYLFPKCILFNQAMGNTP